MNLRNINSEIRAAGAFYKAVSPLGYEGVQKAVGPLSTKAMSVLSLKHLNCEKVNITRNDGTPMRTCIMKSHKRDGKTVGILWLHGGGYSLGAPEMAIMTMPRYLIRNCSCVVISPDYTLSTVKPYPAALNDAFTALQWVKANKKELGITADKIIVGGESAGGGLTAALCLYARDKGEDCIGFQIPLYPMLDDRVTATSANNSAPVWGTKENKSAWHIYLGDRVMNNSVEPYAAPARATDLKGLPPAFSMIGTADPFYGETVDFFERMKQNGVECELKEYGGCFHAFDMMVPFAPISKRASLSLLDKYNEYCKKYIL